MGVNQLGILDIPSLTTTEVPAIDHFAFMGRIGDDSGFALMNINISTVVIDWDGSSPAIYEQGGAPSPTAPELALNGPELHVVNLVDGSERALLSEADEVGTLTWLDRPSTAQSLFLSPFNGAQSASTRAQFPGGRAWTEAHRRSTKSTASP